MRADGNIIPTVTTVADVKAWLPLGLSRVAVRDANGDVLELQAIYFEATARSRSKGSLLLDFLPLEAGRPRVILALEGVSVCQPPLMDGAKVDFLGIFLEGHSPDMLIFHLEDADALYRIEALKLAVSIDYSNIDPVGILP